MDGDQRIDELLETVGAPVKARTGYAVYVVEPDHRVVHWGSQMESLTGALSEEALGKRRYEAVMGEGNYGAPHCTPWHYVDCG